jgi:hypothetical protein
VTNGNKDFGYFDEMLLPGHQVLQLDAQPLRLRAGGDDQGGS